MNYYGLAQGAAGLDAPASGHDRAEEWSLHLHRLVAAKLRENPEGVLAKARRNLAVLRQVHGRSSETYLRRWEALLAGPVEELIRVMTSPAQEARDLRQCTPFAGVLSPGERWEAFRAFRSEWRSRRAAGPA